MKYLFYIYNVLGFKICWWACVLGAISNQKYLGPLLVMLYLSIHLYGVSSELRMSEINLLLIAGVFGTFIDSILLNSSILTYEGLYESIDYIAPPWITAMWIGFTATLNHAFNNIIKKYFTQFVLGLVFGPIAYIAGESIGAIKFNPAYNFNLIIVVIAIVWGLSFPLLCWISNRMRES